MNDAQAAQEARKHLGTTEALTSELEQAIARSAQRGEPPQVAVVALIATLASVAVNVENMIGMRAEDVLVRMLGDTLGMVPQTRAMLRERLVADAAPGATAPGGEA
jgi:hypothetical protein